MFVRSEMESPSGDGNTDKLHPCNPKVWPLKGYDHFTIQTSQDLNMTQSFLLGNTCHYISLSFIMSLHLTNGMQALHPVFVHLKEKRNTGD